MLAAFCAVRYHSTYATIPEVLAIKIFAGDGTVGVAVKTFNALVEGGFHGLFEVGACHRRRAASRQAHGGLTLRVRGERPVVAAFDFDETMTTRDTFVPFLEYAFGRGRAHLALLRLVPEALKVALGMSSRDRLKETTVRTLFRGDSVERLCAAGNAYADSLNGLMRPAALRRVEWHRERGHRLVMVSASLDLYLAPVAEKLGFVDLLCTKPSRRDSVFDGELEGANCRGPEKVRRLEALLGDLSRLELHAYGDSAGDMEMLAAADHSYYRAFEPGGALA